MVEKIKEKTKGKSKIYLIYTAIFFVMSLIIYFIFIKNGKTFIWNSDGYNQHFSILYNFNETIRNAFQNGIPTFNWNLGLGIDVIGQFSYYILGDPFAYITLLFPMDKLDLAYSLLVIVRMYFVGIAFIAYCRYNKKETFNTLLGTIIYTFSGFALYAGVRHPFFLNALIMFPLLLLAIDKLYREDKVKMFIIVVAIAAIMNYYFLYIISILAFIYALMKYLCEYKEHGAKFFFKKLTKAILAYIIGAMVAGILLFPTFHAYMNSNRLGHAESTVYGMKYYKTLFVGLTSNNSLYWSRICISSIVILLAPIMLKNLNKNKENRTIWYCIIIGTIMLMADFFGSFMNGFSFQSNRWVFGYTFLLAYMVVLNFRTNLKYSKNDLLNMGTLLGIYFFGLIVCHEKINIKPSLISCVFALGIFLILYINKKLKHKEKILSYVILLLVMGNIIYYGNDLFSPKGKNYINEFIDQNKVMKNYNSYGGKIKNYDKAINKIKERDDGFYRISNNLYKNTNIALIHDYNSLNAYLSIGNQFIGKLAKDINNRAYNSDTNPLRELDSRTKITTLVGNKYFVISGGDEKYVPYGYERIKKYNSGTKIYENTNSLPIGVFYDNYIKEENYNTLSSLEKEQALLDTAVVSEDVANTKCPNIEQNEGLIEEIKNKTVKKVEYKITDKSKLIKTAEQLKNEDIKNKKKVKTSYQNTINVKEEAQSIQLNIKDAYYCELYVEIKNFNNTSSANKYELNFKYGSVEKNKKIRDAVDDPYYFKTEDMLINLGYKQKHTGNINIIFEDIGEYTYDQINVYAVPMDVYKASVEKLKQTPFNLTKIDDMSIEGNIENQKPGILQISTPYTTGWKAYVDGKETEIINVNTAFIGIALDSGKHEIVFKYETPYLKEGIMVTIAGLILATGIIIFEKKKKKTENI